MSKDSNVIKQAGNAIRDALPRKVLTLEQPLTYEDLDRAAKAAARVLLEDMRYAVAGEFEVDQDHLQQVIHGFLEVYAQDHIRIDLSAPPERQPEQQGEDPAQQP